MHKREVIIIPVNNSPKVSIVIPIYNCERYLPRCLAAVTGQSCRNLEIILIDDASTDESRKISQAYAKQDTRILLLHNEQNRGPAASRNRGIQSMSGEYVYFMDSDDDLHPCAIEILLGHYLRYNVDLVMGNVKRIDFFGQESEDWSGSSRLIPSRGEVTELVAGWMRAFNRYRVFGSAWGKLYRTDIISSHHILFDETIKAWEDIYFVMCYLEHTCSIYYEQKQLYFYYHNQDNHGSAATYRGYMDFTHTVYKARDIIWPERRREVVNALFCHAYSECALRMIFNCVFRMKLSRKLMANLRILVNDPVLQASIAGYDPGEVILNRRAQKLIPGKHIVLLLLVYRLDIRKRKRAREKAQEVQVKALVELKELVFGRMNRWKA